MRSLLQLIMEMNAMLRCVDLAANAFVSCDSTDLNSDHYAGTPVHTSAPPNISVSRGGQRIPG